MSQHSIDQQELGAAGERAPRDPDGRAEGALDPGAFWRALVSRQAERGLPPPRSRYAEAYDLYHDMVARHLPSRGVAFQWVDEAGVLRALSFAELHDATGRLMAAWAAAGVRAGARVCLVMPLGPGYVTAWVTAVRMGLVASSLPPSGDWLLARRLERLAPERVVATPRDQRRLGRFEAIALPDAPPAAGAILPAASSSCYAADSPCALGCSPLAEPSAAPAALGAAQAYHHALRDALLAFLLRPGDALAAPGLDVLQHQPALLMAALLAGATYVHLRVEDVAAEPALLARLRLRSLGVGPALRDALRRAPARLDRVVAHWFKDPGEPYDAHAWSEFVEACGLGETPASNVLVDAAWGGAVLASPRRPGDPGHVVLPAAGVPWTLLDPGSGEEAIGAAGLFATARPGARPRPWHFVLARHPAGLLYCGTPAPRRGGRVVPAADIVEAVADLPFVAGASLVPVPAAGPAGEALFALAVFTGAGPSPEGREADARAAEIRQVLEARLDEALLPDRIDLFPLAPPRNGAGIDHGRCARQYLEGALHRKARHPVFHRISALRAEILSSGAAAAPRG